AFELIIRHCISKLALGNTAQVRRRLLLFAAGLSAITICFGRPPAPVPAQALVVDRSRLPRSLQQVSFKHLSSGALMLLDHNGDLVRPPSLLRTFAQIAAQPGLNVALDPRVGPNIRLGDDPSSLPP